MSNQEIKLSPKQNQPKSPEQIRKEGERLLADASVSKDKIKDFLMNNNFFYLDRDGYISLRDRFNLDIKIEIENKKKDYVLGTDFSKLGKDMFSKDALSELSWGFRKMQQDERGAFLNELLYKDFISLDYKVVEIFLFFFKRYLSKDGNKIAIDYIVKEIKDDNRQEKKTGIMDFL